MNNYRRNISTKSFAGFWKPYMRRFLGQIYGGVAAEPKFQKLWLPVLVAWYDIPTDAASALFQRLLGMWTDGHGTPSFLRVELFLAVF